MTCANIYYSGKDNFAADRAVVKLTLEIALDAAVGAKANRAFLRRVLGRDLPITVPVAVFSAANRSTVPCRS